MRIYKRFDPTSSDWPQLFFFGLNKDITQISTLMAGIPSSAAITTSQHTHIIPILEFHPYRKSLTAEWI